MSPVSIEDFIKIIYAHDSRPPSPATIRRQCPQQDDQGRPLIPGAYKQGKPWKIDLDVYIPEMNRRIRGLPAEDTKQAETDDDDFISDLARRLAS